MTFWSIRKIDARSPSRVQFWSWRHGFSRRRSTGSLCQSSVKRSLPTQCRSVGEKRALKLLRTDEFHQIDKLSSPSMSNAAILGIFGIYIFECMRRCSFLKPIILIQIQITSETSNFFVTNEWMNERMFVKSWQKLVKLVIERRQVLLRSKFTK